MAARVPSVANATIELGFIAAAGALGFMRTSPWALPLLAAAMILYWAFNRRVGLGQLAAMGGVRLISAAAVSITLIGVVLGGAYWIGSLISGRTI